MCPYISLTSNVHFVKTLQLVLVDFKILHVFSPIRAHTSDNHHIDTDFTANGT